LGNINLASLEDISCMKASAILSRAEKKDYFDLYFLLQKFSLDEILSFCEKKFGKNAIEKIMFLKAIVYFEDSNQTTDPKMIKKVSWREVQKFFVNLARNEILK